MNETIFGIFGKKITTTVIALGSLFYSTIQGVNPEFTGLDISINNNFICVSTELQNAFSEDLDEIFMSGSEIKIWFEYQVIKNTGNQVMRTGRYYRTIKYSFINKTYDVYCSLLSEVYPSLSLPRAKAQLSLTRDVPIINSVDLESGTEYQISLRAWIEDAVIPAQPEPIQMKYYWNSLKPEAHSDLFRKSSNVK